jgi:dihydroorotate dehydrogenase
MYRVVRFFLFLFNPEFIHHFTFKIIKIGGMIPGKMWSWRLIFRVKDARLEREVFGLKFDNPVGLAAGFDKDAKLFDELASFGFGFIEIGTVTPLPQDGNPKPRLFRLKDDSGLINRMGFNNQGIEAVVARLRRKKSDIIIGGNIGKNKVTPNEEAANDYAICFEKLFPYVDYFAVNVSSPNTPGLRDLQEKKPLTALLNSLQELNNKKDKRKPILLKIAPDLTNEQLDDIITIVADTKIDGVIATNTTIDRSGLKTDKNKVDAIGNGGLSGKPVGLRSTEVIKYLADKSNRAFPIIGVGGIHSAEDALEKLDAGATLLQVYTGFIYEGPSIVKRINKAILKR